MIEKKDFDVRLSQIDELLGRKLAEGVSDRMQTSVPCLPLEDIGALIDGGMSPEQRDRVLSHLKECSDCYQVFMGTVKTSEFYSAYTKLHPSTLGIGATRTSASSWSLTALATACLILLTVLFYSWMDTEHSAGPETTSIIGRLPRSTQISAKSEYPSFSFSEARSLTSTAFHAGRQLTDLEVSIRANDFEMAIESIRSLIVLLDTTDQKSPILDEWRRVESDYRSGRRLTKYPGKETENFFLQNGAGSYLQFGIWIEASKIAADSRNGSFFKVDEIQYLMEFEALQNAPPGLIRSLNDVKTLLMKAELTEEDYKRLADLFENVILLS